VFVSDNLFSALTVSHNIGSKILVLPVNLLQDKTSTVHVLDSYFLIQHWRCCELAHINN